MNGFGTLTQGVDLTANYPTDLGDMGLINWTLAANYNQTQVSQIAQASFFNPGLAVQLRALRTQHKGRLDGQLDVGCLGRDLARDHV